MEHPKRQYLVLVPEQFTMQTQKELVEMHPQKGIMNIDVLSFQRSGFPRSGRGGRKPERAFGGKPGKVWYCVGLPREREGN